MKHTELPFEIISVSELHDRVSAQGFMMSYIDTCGMFLCQEGTATVALSGRTYKIQAGDMYIYAPSTFVRILSHSEDLRGITIKSSLDVILPFIERASSPRNILLVREHPCIHLTSRQRERLETLLQLFVEKQEELTCMETTMPQRELTWHLQFSLVETIFDEIFLDYFSNQSIEPESLDTKDHIFQTFLVSLMRHYKSHREVTYYAQEQCLSSRYFSAIVKDKTGYSALQWIIQIVISNAKQMLANSDMTVKEIAMEYNFPSQSFFGKYFKQYTGLSPKEYRQQVRQRKLF